MTGQRTDTPDELRALLTARLSPDGTEWLSAALERISGEPTVIRTLFPAVGRRCGHARIAPMWTCDDAARASLLTSLPLRGAELVGEVTELYRYGDAAEKRGVLRALWFLDTASGIGTEALSLVHDALRTNDTRLIAAALGPYGANHLDVAAYRQGVLKCVFYGIPLSDIDGVRERADAELARMLVDYAHERIAAGRSVPSDVWPVIDMYPRVVETRGLRDELHSEVPARSEAAANALAERARTVPSDPDRNESSS